MGTYAPVWKVLKRDNTVSVAIHPKLHKELVRQMSVEKDRDIAHKILLGNMSAPRRAILSKVISGAKVTFVLTHYYFNGLPVIELGDL